jgi:ribosomal-protein-alanine N-acetyltransferase
MIIESTRDSDLPALVELERLCSSHPWSEAMLAAAVGGSAGEQVCVARDEQDPQGSIGFCVYRVVADEAEIHNVAVHPEQRRRGVAHSLLVRSMETAAGAGATVAHLEVRAGNAAAIALYRGLGFELVGRRPAYYASPQEDALLFSARLGQVSQTSGGLR